MLRWYWIHYVWAWVPFTNRWYERLAANRYRRGPGRVPTKEEYAVLKALFAEHQRKANNDN